MKANSASEFRQMLNPLDSSYGIQTLWHSDLEKLKKHMIERVYSLPGEYIVKVVEFIWKSEEEDLKIVREFYQEYPDYYAKHLIETGILELPYALQGIPAEKIKDRIKPADISTYELKCGATNPDYSQAIKTLREILGLKWGDAFDLEAGTRLYELVKNNLPESKWYLASYADPDLLFRDGFREYVLYVDQDLWQKAGIGLKYLAKDWDQVWKAETTGKGTDNSWMADALRRGWGPISMEEYGRRILQDFHRQNNDTRTSVIGDGNWLYDLALENGMSFTVDNKRTLWIIEEAGIRLKVVLSVSVESDNSAPLSLGDGSLEVEFIPGLEAEWSVKENTFTNRQKIEINGYNVECGAAYGWPDSSIFVGIGYTPSDLSGPAVELEYYIEINNIEAIVIGAAIWTGTASSILQPAKNALTGLGAGGTRSLSPIYQTAYTFMN